MRILYYSSHPSLSLKAQTGPGTHMREMIQAMRELGHEVHPVIAADVLSKNNRAPACRPSGAKSFIKSWLPRVLWRSMKELHLLKFDRQAAKILKREISRFNPDLVYERAAYLQASGLKVVKKAGCIHYMEINAPFIHEVKEFEKAPTLWSRKARRIEYWQATRPDKVYVVSSVLKNYYAQYLRKNRHIEVVPNCVNTDKAVCKEELKKAIMERYGLAGKTVVGFVGSIFPYHGVDLLIRAFTEVSKSKPDITLLIVGDGASIVELKELTTQLKLDDQVVFTGSVTNEDVFSYIDLMDIAVMAKSNWYGSPMKLFEYGAMKKPIVAPMNIPVMDVIEKDVDALLTRPDEDAVASAIKALVSDKALRNRLASAFHKKVTQNYTWLNAARTVLANPEPRIS